MAAGRHADERWRSIDLQATAFGGLVLVTAVIGAFLWEIAQAAAATLRAARRHRRLAYLVALVWLRWRS
jgi:hypothetical protein